METPPAATSKSRFILEQVGLDILKGKKVEDIVKHILNVVFCDDEDDSVLKELASIYGSDAALSVFSASSGHGEEEDKKEEKENEVKDLVGAIVKVNVSEGELLELQYVVREDAKVEDVKTSKGLFKRYRMSLLKAAPPVRSDSRLSLSVLDSTGLEVYADESELGLPSQKHVQKEVDDTKSRDMIVVDQSLPASKWSKVGSLDDGIVAQIKFEKRKEILSKYVSSDGSMRCYGFGDMYVSIRPGYIHYTESPPSLPAPVSLSEEKGKKKEKDVVSSTMSSSIEIEIE
jgi:hypothetical protein